MKARFYLTQNFVHLKRGDILYPKAKLSQFLLCCDEVTYITFMPERIRVCHVVVTAHWFL